MKHFLRIVGFQEMKSFIQDDFNKKSYLGIFIILIVAISINYYYDLEDSVSAQYENSLFGWLFFFLLNLVLFALGIFSMKNHTVVQKAIHNIYFWQYLIIVIAVFSVYQSTNVLRLLYQENYPNDYFQRKIFARYNSLVLYILIFVVLGIVIGKGKEKLFGLLNFNISWITYFYFLLCMIPLLMLATTQSDFQKMYPRLHISHFREDYLHNFLQYEPFYMADFILLEWFFRGFMILFFSKFLGKRAIILTAVLYCIFHFGKPLAECISSFFGGYILGYVIYKTKSIYGGITVHMGIALLMDLLAILAIKFL